MAAVLIVFHHFNNIFDQYHYKPLPNWLDWVAKQGHLGVEIFFVLSGFVIAYSLKDQTIDLSFIGRFFMRRSIRLDPPYWIVLGILWFFSLKNVIFHSSPLPSKIEVFTNLFYLSDYFQMPRLLPVSWTLALEIQFYLILVGFLKIIQLLQTHLRLDKTVQFVCYGLMSGFMLFSLTQNSLYHIFGYLPGCFIYYWYSFFIGCMACWSYLKLIPKGVFWLNWCFIALFAWLMEVKGFETCAIACLIYLAAHKDSLHNSLTSPLFQYLGKVSYSLYLVHWLVGVRILDLALRHLSATEDTVIQLGLFFAAFFVTLAATHYFYVLVELPFLKLSQNYGSKSQVAQQQMVG